MRTIISTLLIFVLLTGLGLAQEDLVIPYILKAPGPVTADGYLDEWAFAFPLDHNQKSIPDSGRFKAENPAWVPEDPEDCSGTLYMMYDEEYLYVAAEVRDDFPGHFSEAIWAADAIEFYMGNWDVGDALFPEEHPSGGWPNDASGDYAVQISIAFDESLDSVLVHEYYGVGADIYSENTKVVYRIWDDYDGYTIEGKIFLGDLDSPTTGNFFEFAPGTRIPCTWSLYDMDESESSADFQGFAYTPKGYAGWMGVGPGWQVADVLEKPRGDEWNEKGVFDFVSPYMKRVYRPVTTDGILDEWNFCFPLDHWCSSIPEVGRFNIENPAWFPDDDFDLKGRIMVMYDDEHLYIAASVQDDAPGHFSETIWAADAVEIYLANWDMGDALTPEVHPDGGIPNSANGDYGIQLTCALSEPLDSSYVQVWGEYNQIVQNEETFAAFQIWPNLDGYDFEIQVSLQDLDSPTTGNFIEFIEGMRLPQTWSLYDIDETENSADFQGLAYTPEGYAAWQGPGPGWQYCDVKGISLIEYIDVMAAGTAVPMKVSSERPKSFRLEQNYPNPFNPATNIRFALDKAGEISLKIYNANGQLVKTVIDNERKAAGTYEMSVDMSNLSSGVYLSVLENGNERVQRKMMFIK